MTKLAYLLIFLTISRLH